MSIFHGLFLFWLIVTQITLTIWLTINVGKIAILKTTVADGIIFWICVLAYGFVAIGIGAIDYYYSLWCATGITIIIGAAAFISNVKLNHTLEAKPK